MQVEHKTNQSLAVPNPPLCMCDTKMPVAIHLFCRLVLVAFGKVSSGLDRVISIVTILVTPLLTTHVPPSSVSARSQQSSPVLVAVALLDGRLAATCAFGAC